MGTSYRQPIPAMHRRLTVTTAATNLLLTNVSRVKSSLGITDAAQDALISELIARVSAEIVAYLRLTAANDGSVSTLGVQTYVETIRKVSGVYELFLSRRPITSVTSIVEDGVTLTTGVDFQVNNSVGLIDRLSSDELTAWVGEKIVATYAAGYVLPDDTGTRTLPYEIEEAAIYTIAARMSDLDPASIDPEVKTETLFDVYSATYNTAGVSGKAFGESGSLPHRAMALLASHRYPMI